MQRRAAAWVRLRVAEPVAAWARLQAAELEAAVWVQQSVVQALAWPAVAAAAAAPVTKTLALVFL